ncbi:MAG: helix-turn-helix domain-containing protein, partial [Candidatus Dormibacteraceae bacterium]
MATVQCWTGAETKALRQAMRLSTRAFAAHLGIDTRTINKWEARHTTITLRPHTQTLMDTALARAPQDVQTRFTQKMHTTQHERHPNTAQPATPAHDLAPGADSLISLSKRNNPDNTLTESASYSCIISLDARSKDVAMMQA